MKNLIHNTKNLAELPSKERLINPDRYRGKNHPDHTTDGIWPWKRVDRICEKFIGKQFDKAFSEYCSQVPAYQQHYFLEEFSPKYPKRIWHYSGDYFFVDKQGNIRKHKVKKIKNPVYFRSDDFKTEKRHKETGKPYPTYTWMDKKFKESDYENVTVSGYQIQFSSKNDPEWIRLTTDQRKRRAAAQRKAMKEAQEKAYSFISKSEKEIEKDKAKDKVKIEAKGFDYLTSFRNENQLHPDVIKTNQGF